MPALTKRLTQVFGPRIKERIVDSLVYNVNLIEESEAQSIQTSQGQGYGLSRGVVTFKDENEENEFCNKLNIIKPKRRSDQILEDFKKTMDLMGEYINFQNQVI